MRNNQQGVTLKSRNNGKSKHLYNKLNMKLVLDPPTIEDAEQFFEMNQDDAFQKMFRNLKNQTYEHAYEFLERICTKKGWVDYVFIKITDDFTTNPYTMFNSRIIGFISINRSGNEDFNNSGGFAVLLNFGIISKFHNKGLMTQALKLRLNHYESSSMNYLAASVKDNNLASKSVLLKCGFKLYHESPLSNYYTYIKNISMSENEFITQFNNPSWIHYGKGI
jgi:RimJ/RimL family protein N-acetyltransferase